MLFRQPNEIEFEQVKQLVEELWLDNGNMKPEQFTVLSDNGKIVAFGRVKEHPDAMELCSIGVAKDSQGKGFGKKIVNHLLARTKGDVYLVTVIPGFFSNIGFSKAEIYPDSLKHKVEICTKDYHVDDPYFVMKWEKKDF